MGLFFSSAESLLLHNMEPAGIPDSACTTLAGKLNVMCLHATCPGLRWIAAEQEEAAGASQS